ncbi:YSC84-related protein [Wenxinia saemankumensis]|nr:lipid-binding SYLF domain-containing protein [Wenxinia saemankumensis]
MTDFTRRGFGLALAGAATGLAACGNPIGGDGPAIIDARVAQTLQYMYREFPGTQDLATRASGLLVMPLVTEAGIGLGGAYGRGALVIGQTTVDYYSQGSVSGGLQIGAQQYSHVLFFMTPEALMEFRTSDGWAVGGDIEFAYLDRGETLRAETTTSLSPVIAVIFAQTGLRVGATLEGTKYTRIIP